MSEFPYTRNGWVDTGAPIKAYNRRNNCSNCGSDKYIETISTESCRACGLHYSYWSAKGNAVYDAYQKRTYALYEAEAERQRMRDEEDEQ